MLPTVAKPFAPNDMLNDQSKNEDNLYVSNHEAEIEIEKEKEKETDFITEFVTSTSISGIPNLFKADGWFFRIFWLVLILAAISGCIYFIVICFIQYFSYGVFTAYTTNYQTPMNYPAITICNLAPFNTLSPTVLQYYQNILTANNINTNIVPTNSNPGIEQIRIIRDFLKAQIISNTSATQSFLQSIGYTYDDLVISCYFNQLQCTSNDFTWFFDYNYGNCYTFNANSSSVKKISKAGPMFGLQLELFTGIPGTQDYYTDERGIYLAVTTSGTTPVTSYTGVKLPVSQATNIKISQTSITNLPAPFSACRQDVSTLLSSDNSIYKRTLQLNTYSIPLCYDLCLQSLFIVPKCNCSDPSLPLFDTSTIICKTLIKLKCAKSTKDTFDNTPLSTTCANYCPTPCNNYKYDTTQSSSGYPTDYYFNVLATTPNLISKFQPYLTANNLNINQSKAQLVSSVLKVNVFYNDLTYVTLIDSQTVTVATLFGNIGGELGIFLGMSLLTFFELFEFSFKIIENLIKKSKNKVNTKK